VSDALARKRLACAVIGYSKTVYLCLACAPPEEALYQFEELREGDDAGVPFECERCGVKLAPRHPVGESIRSDREDADDAGAGANRDSRLLPSPAPASSPPSTTRP
jgi:hypothetical protein